MRSIGPSLLRWRPRVAERYRDRYEKTGRRLAKADRLEEARVAFRTSLALEPARRPIDDFLLDGTPASFLPRRRIAHWVQDELAEIQAAARARAPTSPTGPRRIFVYWAQGWADAPAIVRACHRQLVAVNGPETVVALDDGSLRDWVDLPPDVVERAARSLTQYSDLVRSALLADFGGTWVDATVLVTRPLDELYERLAVGGFFAFRYRPARPASWVMMSAANGIVMTMLLVALVRYWRQHEQAGHYFLFHDIFEALCFLDPAFRAVVDAAPMVRPDWSLTEHMRDPYDPGRLDAILARTFAHKLTYKQPEAERETGTIFRHLLDHGVARAPGPLPRA